MKQLENPLNFILAGKAIFTLVSAKTQKRYTYKVKKLDDEQKRLWFVSLLNGADNNSDYMYMGIIVPGQGNQYLFRSTKRSRVADSAPSFRAIQWSIAQLSTGSQPTDLEIYHEGRCGRCGRRLTVPESIDSGFGPECLTKV